MTRATLTKAGHTLYIQETGRTNATEPAGADEWVWWVNDARSNQVCQEEAIGFGPLDDARRFTAYSRAERLLRGKAEIIEFDELDWS